jgi:hypothetical protein
MPSWTSPAPVWRARPSRCWGVGADLGWEVRPDGAQGGGKTRRRSGSDGDARDPPVRASWRHRKPYFFTTHSPLSIVTGRMGIDGRTWTFNRCFIPLGAVDHPPPWCGEAAPSPLSMSTVRLLPLPRLSLSPRLPLPSHPSFTRWGGCPPSLTLCVHRCLQRGW